MMVSRRITLLNEIRREDASAVALASDVNVDFTVDLEGAGIVPRPLLLLRQFSLVFGLDGFQESSSVLLAADHFLEFRCPALGEDSTGRVSNEVHRRASLADHGPSSK